MPTEEQPAATVRDMTAFLLGLLCGLVVPIALVMVATYFHPNDPALSACVSSESTPRLLIRKVTADPV